MLMKFIRIFLLVLIIVGIWLIATQKSWVPKFADAIVAAQDLGTPEDVPPGSLEPHTAKEGEHCGGFIRTPGVCEAGFICTSANPTTRVVGDTGGICKKVSLQDRFNLFWDTFHDKNTD